MVWETYVRDLHTADDDQQAGCAQLMSDQMLSANPH
jgi:hypothetical protein